MSELFVELSLVSLLVLFFGIQQRRRPEQYCQMWLVGWLWVFVSVGLWEGEQLRGSAATLLECLRLNALALGGLCFVFSFVSLRAPNTPLLRCGLVIAIPACIAIDLATVHSTAVITPLLVVGSGHLAAGVVTVALIPKEQHRLRTLLLVIFVGNACCMLYLVSKGQISLIGNYVLAEVFLFAGVLFLAAPFRGRTGRVLGVVGFATWAAGYVLDALPYLPKPIAFFVHEAWNIPKHFVGFGMILILFRGALNDSQDLSQQYKSLYDEFRMLYEGNPHPMWIQEPGTGRFLSVNEAATHQYGYTKSEFLAMTTLDIRPKEDIASMVTTMTCPNNLATQTWKHVRKNGSVCEVDITGHDILYKGAQARFVLAIDISEREELHRQLRHLAHHDALTALPNRTLFEQRLEEALSRADSEGNKVAILTIDVDRFKQINDTLGHLTGDECLLAVAKRLGGQIRQPDTIARTGGEEFTAIICGFTQAEAVEKVSTAVLDLFLDTVQTRDHEVRISVSIGVAIYPDDGENAETLRKRSDQALYEAKRSGGNQAVFASEEVYVPIDRANTIESLLRRALQDQTFEVNYQPVVDANGNLVYFEALLRAVDAELALIGPAGFIPIAEDCGLIMPIGRWVLQEACRQIRAWLDSGLPYCPVAVNISAKQMLYKEFQSEVLRIADIHNIPPGCLAMELTETTIMNDHSPVQNIMSGLADAGIEFAIDDFGTGYSSLARLNDLPITALKIDRSFIERMETAAARTIVVAVIQMAQNLKLRVVAEGVQTPAQFESLRMLGCDLFQGYLFSPPLSAMQATAFLTSSHSSNNTVL